MTLGGIAPAVAFGHWSTTDPVLDADVNSEARRLYTDKVKVFLAEDHEFRNVFSRYVLYAVVNLTLHPAQIHAMAYDPGLHKGYDVTRHWGLLVADFPPDSDARASSPNLSGAPTILIAHTGTAPEGIDYSGLPAAWVVAYQAVASSSDDLVYDNSAHFESSTLPVTDWDTVRPGTRLRFAKGAGEFSVCTAGYLFMNATGTFITSAGHCAVKVGQSTACKPLYACRQDVIGSRVQACVENCGNANSQEAYCTGVGQWHCVPGGRYAEIGSLVYANANDEGEEDVLLVKLDAINYDAAVAFWGGPQYSACSIPGIPVTVVIRDSNGHEAVHQTVTIAYAPVLFYGHGSYVGDTVVTKPRAGLAISCDGLAYWGPTAPGDSGMPVSVAAINSEGVLVAKYAGGIHGRGGANPYRLSTPVATAQALFSQDLPGSSLSLLCPGVCS